MSSRKHNRLSRNRNTQKKVNESNRQKDYIDDILSEDEEGVNNQDGHKANKKRDLSSDEDDFKAIKVREPKPALPSGATQPGRPLPSHKKAKTDFISTILSKNPPSKKTPRTGSTSTQQNKSSSNKKKSGTVPISTKSCQPPPSKEKPGLGPTSTQSCRPSSSKDGTSAHGPSSSKVETSVSASGSTQSDQPSLSKTGTSSSRSGSTHKDRPSSGSTRYNRMVAPSNPLSSSDLYDNLKKNEARSNTTTSVTDKSRSGRSLSRKVDSTGSSTSHIVSGQFNNKASKMTTDKYRSDETYSRKSLSDGHPHGSVSAASRNASKSSSKGRHSSTAPEILPTTSKSHVDEHQSVMSPAKVLNSRLGSDEPHSNQVIERDECIVQVLEKESIIEEGYDYAVIGTGIKEYLLLLLLTMDGKKILHLAYPLSSANADCGYSLHEIMTKLGIDEGVLSSDEDNQWNIDLIPRHLVKNGILHNVLSYFCRDKLIQLRKINRPLMYTSTGICDFLKYCSNNVEDENEGSLDQSAEYMKSFLSFLNGFDSVNKETWLGLNLDKILAEELLDFFKLEACQKEIVKHGLSMTFFENITAVDFVNNIVSNIKSVASDCCSPLVYPVNGYKALVAEICRILKSNENVTVIDDQEVIGVENLSEGKLVGIRTNVQAFSCKRVFSQCLGFAHLRMKNGYLVVGVGFIKEIPLNMPEFEGSLHLVVQQQTANGRCNVIHVSILGEEHKVAAKNWYQVILSTHVTDEIIGKPYDEIKYAVDLLPGIVGLKITVTPLYKPREDVRESGLMLLKSIESSNLLDTCLEDVKYVYEKGVGRKLEIPTMMRLGESDLGINEPNNENVLEAFNNDADDTPVDQTKADNTVHPGDNDTENVLYLRRVGDVQNKVLFAVFRKGAEAEDEYVTITNDVLVQDEIIKFRIVP